MNLVYRRISAFIFDMLFITFLTVAISNLSYLNPYKYNYEEASTNYQSIYGEVINNLESTSIDSMLEKISVPYMNIEKYGIFNTIYYLGFSFLYFALFSYFNNGQTLGKKIFKIKIANKKGEKATFIQMLLRNLIYGSNLYLGINVFLLIKIVLVFSIKNAIPFYYAMMILTYVQFIIEIISIVCLFKNKDRSLSDLISGTKVIDLK